nr:immunoglobulin heavy chain junction region [Mus musculus]
CAREPYYDRAMDYW